MLVFLFREAAEHLRSDLGSLGTCGEGFGEKRSDYLSGVKTLFRSQRTEGFPGIQLHLTVAVSLFILIMSALVFVALRSMHVGDA